MMHLVFQEPDIEVLQKAIALDQSLAGNIVIIRDNYMVGPIEAIDQPEGYQQRREWWKNLLDFSPYNTEQVSNMVDDRLTVHNLKQQLTENSKEELWIWMAQNAHDVCGYYWLISQLAPFQGRVVVLYMNNLPFINEKRQLFYPANLHEIQPREFLKAKKLNRKVTLSEFEVDPDEWKKLCSENAMIRILEGGKKIVSKEPHFFDNEIIQALSKDWQKGGKAVQNILNKLKVKTGDVFILWRLQQLAQQQKIEMNGTPANGWKDFEIRLKSTENLAQPNTTNS